MIRRSTINNHTTPPKDDGVRERVLVPPNAADIIARALEAEEQCLTKAKTKVEQFTSERKVKLERAKMLHEQVERRRLMENAEFEAVQTLKEMVSAVGRAIRDRQTTLKSDGLQSHTFPNGDTYTGEWKNSNLHGQGHARFEKSHLEYNGDWFVGTRNGQGTFTDHNTTTRYTGRWYEGRRHGRGELVEPEGVYSGEFRDGKFSGHGEYRYLDGHSYKGDWLEGFYEGNGVYTFPSGARYEGAWKRGTQQGKGTMHYSPTEYYEGEWYKNMRHGRGMLVTAEGTVKGRFVYDTCRGRGEVHYEDGSTYEGQLEKTLPNGEGRLTSGEDSAVYTGEFKQGLRHGKGKYENPDTRTTVDCDWVNDKKNGPNGVCSVSGMGTIHGAFEGDQLHGAAKFVPENGETAQLSFEKGRCTERREKAFLGTLSL